jgi:biotin transport system substrate-specific component
MEVRDQKLRMLIFSAMFAAITGILAQVEIPLPLVPISGQTLAVGLAATILGSRFGATAMLVYAIIGAVGVPVFAGFAGGAHILLGKTGGYIFGFIITAYITGLILERTKFNLFWAMIANLIGMVITLACGAVQLKYVLDLTWQDAWLFGVYPFILGGIVKAFLASWIGIKVRERLITANLLPKTKTETKEDINIYAS